MGSSSMDRSPLVPSASTTSRNQPTPPVILGHTINMASLAFGAYLEPAAGGGFQKRSAGATLTQYTSADVVRTHYTGVLNVTIHKATNFKGCDRWSAPDLRVEVSAGDSYGTTTLKNNTAEPVWDETVLLWPERPMAKQEAPDLHVSVFDADTFGAELMGTGSVALGNNWRDLSHAQQTIEIYEAPGKDGKPGAVAGQVTVTLTAVVLSASAHAEGVKKSEAEKKPGGAAATPPPKHAAEMQAPQQLPGEADAAQLFAAVEKPPLQITPEATADIRVSIATSVALDPDLEGAAAVKPGRPAAAKPGQVAEGTGVAAAVELPVDPEGMQKLTDARTGLEAIFPDSFLQGSKAIAYLDAPTDTQVWVHCNNELKQVVISFRGTTSMTDWKYNAAATLKTVVPDPETGALRTWRDTGPGAKRGLNLGPLNALFRKGVHSGFYGAYRSVEAEVREVVDLCTRREPGWSVITTGHSLGGALATLCAYDLAISRDFEYDVSAYTFGSPRVGNHRFARAYNRVVPRTFRMLNTHDIVPQLPPFMIYKHVGHEGRLYTNPGMVGLPHNNEVSLFGHAMLSRTTRKKVVKRLSVFDKSTVFLRRIRRLFLSIFSRSFVSSHLGDKYMESLCDLMDFASADSPPNTQHAVRDLRAAVTSAKGETAPAA